MVVALVLALLSQQAPCREEATALTIAAARAGALDPAGAANGLEAPGLRGCVQADTAVLYLRGLLAARAAYAEGGSAASLAPVRTAIDGLAAIARGRPGPAEIARLVLVAGSAAAQSEREEMGVFLSQATAMEALQLAAGQPGAPLVPALEVSGDMWLQVHRYDDARLAYQRAAAVLGATPRITAGLARVAARVNDAVIACSQFRVLLAWWGPRSDQTPEIDDARAYLSRPGCGAP